MKIEVNTYLSPKAIGPYSQATLFGNILFTSGQIALHPETSVMQTESIEQEIKQVMNNLEYILKEAGFNWTHVMKTTIYLKDLGNFEVVNRVYESYLQTPYPARETVQVSRLPKEANVEISVIALKS